MKDSLDIKKRAAKALGLPLSEILSVALSADGKKCVIHTRTFGAIPFMDREYRANPLSGSDRAELTRIYKAQVAGQTLMAGDKVFLAEAWGRALLSGDKKLAELIVVMAQYSQKRKNCEENPVKYGRGAFVHRRLAAPGRFDPRSFRTVALPGGKKEIIVGCPKGSYSPSRRVCKVGMKRQALLTRKNAILRKFWGTKRRGNPLTDRESAALIREAREHRRDSAAHRSAYLKGFDLGTAAGLTEAVAHSGSVRAVAIAERAAAPRGLRRRNPLPVIAPRVTAIEYSDVEKARREGLTNPERVWRHEFPKSGARATLYGLPDGSVLVKGRKKVWRAQPNSRTGR